MHLCAHTSCDCCRDGVASAARIYIKGAVPGANMAAVKFKTYALAQRWNNVAMVHNTFVMKCAQARVHVHIIHNSELSS